MVRKKMEGSEEQRREMARRARARGKLPSEMGATTGASKQRTETHEKAAHAERLETKHRGKLGTLHDEGGENQPRPRSRQRGRGD